MRVFIAINLSPEERRRLDSAAEVLRDSAFPIRWVKAESVHLTLKFLGEIDVERVPEVGLAVDVVVAGFGSFELVTGGFGAFPSLERPQVVWAGVESSRTLEKIQGRIEAAMEEFGYQREQRSFHAHLTLGRARKGTGRGAFRGLSELMRKSDYRGAIRVGSIDVMRSRLIASGGAIYNVVHSSQLQG